MGASAFPFCFLAIWRIKNNFYTLLLLDLSSNLCNNTPALGWLPPSASQGYFLNFLIFGHVFGQIRLSPFIFSAIPL